MQKKQEIQPLTRKKAVGGKVVHLSKQSKRIAASFFKTEQRRHYLNLMLQATVAANGPSREAKSGLAIAGR